MPYVILKDFDDIEHVLIAIRYPPLEYPLRSRAHNLRNVWPSSPGLIEQTVPMGDNTYAIFARADMTVECHPILITEENAKRWSSRIEESRIEFIP